MTASDALWRLDAHDLAAAFAAGRATPLDALAVYRDRIARLDPAINAYVAANPAAEAEARESTRRWRAGLARSPLDGVPVAVKDNLVAAGMPAAWGSRAYAGDVAERDELPVERLRAAGAVVLGKTNVPEFTVEGYTANALFGVTRNPWDPALTPGGSSGGSVAAVAAGLAPLALGTDGGGSIRRPAAYTGLVGLKPSLGRVPRGGGLPQILLDFEVVGPLTRTVRDAAAVLAVLAGTDRRDPRSRGIAAAGAPPGPMRILYAERLGDAPLDPVVAAAARRAADALAGLGNRVERGPLPLDLDAVTAFWPAVAQVGLARLRAIEPRLERAEPRYLALAEAGARMTAPDFLAGLQAVEELRAAASRLFADWDVVVTPACAAMPWPAEEAYPPVIDGAAVGPRGHAVYTGWVNAAGHPALTVPAPVEEGALPVGVQLIGDLGAEERLLGLAAAYEEAHPWSARRPTDR
ncbi:amidase [Azospirillum sp. ST 5-10]|uniref:amidase n=1 Tax=unclassified Azospirillum TaxID=2630922 RepID=UPI003F4A35F7